MRTVLPEIALLRRDTIYLDGQGNTVKLPARKGPPEFPATCPACGAGADQLESRNPWRGFVYACGAEYTEKSQIQNHTDKWWGVCPGKGEA